MYRGTTPTIKLEVRGLRDIDIDKIFLTLAQRNTIVEKTNEDLKIEDDNIEVTLDQIDTLVFSANMDVQLQVRVLSKGGTAYATQILAMPIDKILKEGEIK